MACFGKCYFVEISGLCDFVLICTLGEAKNQNLWFAAPIIARIIVKSPVAKDECFLSAAETYAALKGTMNVTF